MILRLFDRLSLHFGEKYLFLIYYIFKNILQFLHILGDLYHSSFDLQVGHCIFRTVLCYMELLYKY